MKLSVIAPIYNVEKYLENCVKSILENINDKTEVLLVDDGSTDKSGEVAEKLAKQDKRIKVFHKTNGGLGDARNYGIKKASGEYVCFVDSDDSVNSEFKKVYEQLDENIDVIFCGFNAFYGEDKKEISYKKEEIFKGNENCVLGALKVCTKFNSACIKFFRRDFILSSGLIFNKGFTEDFNFLGKVMCHIESAKLTTIKHYDYIVYRTGSIMNTVKKQRFYDLFDQVRSIYDEIKESKLSKKAERRLKEFITFNILSNYRSANKLNKDDYNEVIALLNENKQFVKYPKGFIMRGFVLLSKIFGYKTMYKIFK